MMPAAAHRGGDRQHAARAGHERVPDLARAHPVALVQEREQEREHGRVHHGAERREVQRQQHHDQHQRREVVAPAREQPPEPGRLEVQPLDLEAARVGLDREQDPEVVEERRDERVDEHLQVGDLQELGDDEGGRAERRRRQDRADARRREHGAALVLRVAGAAQQRPGDRAERDRGGDAGARDGAEQEAGQRGRAAGAGAAAPERGVGELDEEARGARVLEHRAVDREQHDVGRGDVERDAEHPLQAHVALADDAVDAVALVGEPERVGDQPAEVGVGDEREHDRGQHPADRAARRLEDQQHRRDAEDDVERLGRGGAAEQLVGRDGGVARRTSAAIPSIQSSGVGFSSGWSARLRRWPPRKTMNVSSSATARKIGRYCCADSGLKTQ